MAIPPLSFKNKNEPNSNVLSYPTSDVFPSKTISESI